MSYPPPLPYGHPQQGYAPPNQPGPPYSGYPSQAPPSVNGFPPPSVPCYGAPPPSVNYHIQSNMNQPPMGMPQQYSVPPNVPYGGNYSAPPPNAYQPQPQPPYEPNMNSFQGGYPSNQYQEPAQSYSPYGQPAANTYPQQNSQEPGAYPNTLPQQYDQNIQRANGSHGGGVMGKITNIIGGMTGNSSSIQQLLQKASHYAIQILGVTDGYFHHAVAKIVMPQQLSLLVQVAKRFKLEAYVEKFILSMNRAAEQAASKALPIFQRFISTLSLNDAASLVGAKNNEATQYFREHTERDLEQAYAPVVAESMNSWNVTRQFQEIQQHTKNIPGLRSMNMDIQDYTIKKALHGLFYVLGEQEQKIRADPKGQISTVFNHLFHHP